MFITRLIILTLVSICSVLGKKICDYEDSNCLTKGAQRLYQPFVLGTIPGVKSSEPLRKDLIEGSLPTMKYKLTDSTLSGMKDCDVKSVIVSVKESKYDYNVSCPHLIMETEFELKGESDSKMYEGTGSCKVNLHDIEYYMHGEYSKRIDETGKAHFQLKNHILETDPRGKIEYDSVSHSGEPKDKSIENCQLVVKLSNRALMDAFMDIYLGNLQSFFNAKSTDDIYYYPE